MEVWKSIAEQEGIYEVSSKGRIRSLRRNIFLKSRPNTNGYPSVSLCEDGIIKERVIHRLVADAFLVKPSDFFTEVNHINGDKLYNVLTNLEWSSPTHNIRHAWQLGLTVARNKYMGVRLDPSGKWRYALPSLFSRTGKAGYSTEEAAAKAYDRAIKSFGYHKEPYWLPLNFEEVIVPRLIIA